MGAVMKKADFVPAIAQRGVDSRHSLPRRLIVIRIATRFLMCALALSASAMLIAACGDDDSAKKDKADTAMSDETTATTESTMTDTTATTDAAGGSGAAGGTLTATVGPGFDISLKDTDGNDVTDLKAGDYTVKVDDKSDIHNFHLSGPGVEETTDVSGTGSDSWNVTFKAGNYTFQCDPHADSMNGAFTVA
jgi:plastocyanin